MLSQNALQFVTDPLKERVVVRYVQCLQVQMQDLIVSKQYVICSHMHRDTQPAADQVRVLAYDT